VRRQLVGFLERFQFDRARATAAAVLVRFPVNLQTNPILKARRFPGDSNKPSELSAAHTPGDGARQRLKSFQITASSP
jgi:hypothetical protein